ncbi:type II toxin-antitoxin system RelE/ParE family toxin [Pseudomonas baetica]|uniref:type II toxin-antitoxin system RelE/ParE family toxin n=1 Tax=Pseudomonas baetica TaxID=674054 RepID=UPI000C2C15C5|nr:type II toxin-antitoxin system RelE/ParE family toxin [Pseudomonas baetica]PTC17140.1 type II toxin-antitoxin system RelE/ParE family toxin [Pseudomonas baetica]
MPNIALTDKADSDLESIHEYYATRIGAESADGVVAQILESLERLETFTGLGRPSQAPDVRELVLSRFPFIAPYRVVGNEVQILRILHERTERSEDW